MKKGPWRRIAAVAAAIAGVLFGLWAGIAVVRPSPPAPTTIHLEPASIRRTLAATPGGAPDDRLALARRAAPGSAGPG